MSLVISQAKYINQWFTPLQFLQKKELQNKAKKKTTEKLRCADGCELVFRNGCEYINAHGTLVSRQPHFAHTSKQREKSCFMVRKYGAGGESYEHLKTKMNIATFENSCFVRTCCDRDCNFKKRYYRSAYDWYTKIEHKINNKWLVDVAFFNKKTDKLELVVEIKHKHAVDGKKRQWLIEQKNLLYFEVPSNIESHTHNIIDTAGTYFCRPVDQISASYCQKGADRRWQKYLARMEKKREQKLKQEQEEMYKRKLEERKEKRIREEKEKRIREEKEENEARQCYRKKSLHWDNCTICDGKETFIKNNGSTSFHCLCTYNSLEGMDLLYSYYNYDMTEVQRQRWNDCYNVKRKDKFLLEKMAEKKRKRLLIEEQKRQQLLIEEQKQKFNKNMKTETIYNTKEEMIEEAKKERLRQKQKEKREELKLLELQKKTVKYQKMINNNRKAFGLKKRKLQSSMQTFFKTKKTKKDNKEDKSCQEPPKESQN